MDKDASKIADNEIDDYIKKYVKIKKVNKAKLKALTVVPTLVLATIVGVITVGAGGVTDSYKEVKTYDIKYADDNSNYIVQKDVPEDQIGDNIITVKLPLEKQEDGTYIRKIMTFETEDDLSEKISDFVYSNPSELAGNLVDDDYDKISSYEHIDTIDGQSDNGEIFVLYSEQNGIIQVPKSKSERFLEILGTAILVFGGGLVGYVYSPNINDSKTYRRIYYDKVKCDSKIKSLTKKKKKENNK